MNICKLSFVDRHRLLIGLELDDPNPKCFQHYKQLFLRAKRYPLKCSYFTAIGSPSVKTVANKHRHAAYYNKHLGQSF